MITLGAWILAKVYHTVITKSKKVGWSSEDESEDEGEILIETAPTKLAAITWRKAKRSSLSMPNKLQRLRAHTVPISRYVSIDLTSNRPRTASSSLCSMLALKI